MRRRKEDALSTGGTSFSLLMRGEFRVRNGIVLMALYGAAILTVPLMLNSIFALSSLTLGFSQYETASEILASFYGEILGSYEYVVVALFAGFVVACFLIGRSFGRNFSRNFSRIIAHSGGDRATLSLANNSVLLVVSFSSSLLAFCISTVLVLAALYPFSILIHAPYVLPNLVDLNFGLAIALVFLSSFISMLAGSASSLSTS